jgi:hypothetical protein
MLTRPRERLITMKYSIPAYDVLLNVPDVWGDYQSEDKYFDDEELYEDFLKFFRYVFAWLGLPAPTRAQLELARYVSDQNNPHRMLMCLRGLSKSLTSQIYVLWRLLNDPDEHILVMSATGKRARNYTAFVQKLIKLLPVAQHLTPRHNIERTSGDSFDVQGATESDSPSVYAVGVGNAIAGFRATIVIYDDIESAQNSSSVVLREKLEHFASEANNLLMADKDESITLCTPHSRDSIYMDWIEKGYDCMIIPAQYPESDATYGVLLAPYLRERMKKFPSLTGTAVDERFPMSVLDSKRMRVGKSQYKLQYLLDTSESDAEKYPLKLSDLIIMDVDEKEAPIKVNYSSMPENTLHTRHHGFKLDRLYQPSFVSKEKMPYNTTVMAIDPSGRGADETGYAIGHYFNTRIFLSEIGGFKGGYDDDTLLQIVLMAKRKGVKIIVIESNFGDGAFAKMLRPVLQKNYPVCGIEETRATGQKEVRLISILEPLMNQHRLVVDKNLIDRDYEKTAMYSFTYQLTHLTSQPKSLRHDDALDAVEMVCSYLLELLDGDEDEGLLQHREKELDDYYQKYVEIYGDMTHMVDNGNPNFLDSFR